MATPKTPLPEEALAAIARGDLLAAIKALRKAGPIDLASAKRAIEAHARELAAQHSAPDAPAKEAMRAAHPPSPLSGKRPPTVAPGDSPGSMRWLLLVLALVAAGVWWGFR